jgi:hypothetical protein
VAGTQDAPDHQVELYLASLLLRAWSIEPSDVKVAVVRGLNDEPGALEVRAQVVEESVVAGSYSHAAGPSSSIIGMDRAGHNGSEGASPGKRAGGPGAARSDQQEGSGLRLDSTPLCDNSYRRSGPLPPPPLEGRSERLLQRSAAVILRATCWP